MAAPNKEQRQICWNTRDKYFECLDKNNDDESKCQDVKAAFDEVCSSIWVKHFIRRRSFIKYNEELQKENEKTKNNI